MIHTTNVLGPAHTNFYERIRAFGSVCQDCTHFLLAEANLSLAFANQAQLRPTETSLAQREGTLTNGAQLSPTFISKRQQIFGMLKMFSEHHVRQRLPPNTNFHQLLPAEPDICPNVGKRWPKRCSVNPPLTCHRLGASILLCSM